MRTDEAGFAADAIQRLVWLASAGRQLRDLTPAQWSALRFFHRASNTSRTLTAFTDFHATTCASASQTVNGLARKGLLARRASRRDRRKANFELTEKGRSMLEQDPLNDVVALIDALPEDRKSDLAAIMLGLMARIGHARRRRAFGTCVSCAFLKENCNGNARLPEYVCTRGGEEIADGELHRLCMESVPKAGALAAG